MIDYQNISDSIEHYEKMGYHRIEVPWTVTKSISDITKPKLAGPDFELIGKNKVLVASGEQSFLYLYLKGFLPKGKFQAVTPCFREEIFDQTHSKYFLKNELIITDNVNEDELSKLVHCAFKFFMTRFKEDIEKNPLGTLNIKEYKSENNESCYDIEYVHKGKFIELGSYGIRRCEYLTWIYGTGCAEPRLSYCQKLKSNLNGIPSETY